MTEPTLPIRVAIYGRVSSERQEKEKTIESQIAQDKAHVEKAGYLLVEIYIDNGYSGELLARPGLDRLRDDAATGKFDRVIISCPDRLARKYLYQELVIDELRKHGVVVEFLDRPKVAETPEEKLSLGVQGLVAEYEKTRILERTRRGKLHKARRGLIVGGRAPYGYRYAKGSGRYEVEDREAQTVRDIFEWMDQGETLRGVVRQLTFSGVPKPTVYGFRTQWGRSTVSRIVTNPTYTGTTFFNKNRATESARKSGSAAPRAVRTSRKLRPREEWIPIQVPAIVDPSLFQRVQERLQKNRIFANGRAKRSYLLRGLISCPDCGAGMVGDPGKGTPFYRCSDRGLRFPEARQCPGKGVRADRVEGAVWGAMVSALRDPALIRSQMDAIREAHKEARPAPRPAEEIARERARLAREEDRLLEAYSAEAVSLDQLKGRMGVIRARLKALAEQEATAQAVPQEDPLADFESLRLAILVGLEKAEFDVLKRQEVLRTLVTGVVVRDRQVRIRCALPSRSLSTPSARCGQRTEFDLVTKL